MLMVAHQVGVHAVLFEDLRHRLVERLQRAPTPVKKVIAASVELPARRDTGHTTHIGVVEGN
jgi:hypothetical protein